MTEEIKNHNKQPKKPTEETKSQKDYSQQYQDIINLFSSYFLKPDITEIFVNKPEEIIIIHNDGKTIFEKNTSITADLVNNLLKLTGNITNNKITPEKPTISSKIPLPNYNQRISGIWRHFTEEHCCLSIRTQKKKIIPLKNFFSTNIKVQTSPKEKLTKVFKNESVPIIKKIESVIEYQQNLLIVGGTGTGKTSLLNSLIKKAIPKKTRIITLENAREIFLPMHTNKLHIISGDTNTNSKHILNIILRLKPTWIILGEISIQNSSYALNYAKTGHSLITTIHAGSPTEAINRLAENIMQNTSQNNIKALEQSITLTFPYIIQITTDGKNNFNTKLYEMKYKNNQIDTTEIF